MAANEELDRVLAKAAHLFTDFRSVYGGDLKLEDLKGPKIVAELRRVRSMYPEYSSRAGVIIALIAEASISDKAKLDPRT